MPFPFIAAAAVAAPLIGGLVNGRKKRDARQQQQNEKNRDYDNWYNSPAEQRKRHEAAGLNPHTMSGAPTQSTTPNAQISEHQNIGEIASQGINNYQNLSQQGNANKLLQTQQEAHNSRMLTEQMLRQGINIDNLTATENYARLPMKNDYSLEAMNISNNKSMVALEQAQLNLTSDRTFKNPERTSKLNAQQLAVNIKKSVEADRKELHTYKISKEKYNEANREWGINTKSGPLEHLFKNVANKFGFKTPEDAFGYVYDKVKSQGISMADIPNPIAFITLFLRNMLK